MRSGSGSSSASSSQERLLAFGRGPAASFELRKRKLWERATTIDVGEDLIPEEDDREVAGLTSTSSSSSQPRPGTTTSGSASNGTEGEEGQRNLRRGYSVTYRRAARGKPKVAASEEKATTVSAAGRSRSETLSSDLWRSLLGPQPFWFQK